MSSNNYYALVFRDEVIVVKGHKMHSCPRAPSIRYSYAELVRKKLKHGKAIFV